jgi:hypothetical protein
MIFWGELQMGLRYQQILAIADVVVTFGGLTGICYLFYLAFRK